MKQQGKTSSYTIFQILWREGGYELWDKLAHRLMGKKVYFLTTSCDPYMGHTLRLLRKSLKYKKKTRQSA